MTNDTASADPGRSDRPRSTLPRLRSTDVERYGLLAVWAGLIILFGLTVPSFFLVSTLQIVLGSQATQIVIALAVLVALAGGSSTSRSATYFPSPPRPPSC